MTLTQKVTACCDLKKIRPGLTGRIAKIGRHAVAMAVFALAGMMFAGGAIAADWILGATIAGTNSTGTTFYNSNVSTYDYGVLLGSNPTAITNTQGTSTTFLTGTIRATTYMANIFSALGTVNGYGAADNYILGSGAVIKALTTGTAASGQYAPTQNFNPVFPFNYVNTTWNGSIGLASAVNAYAISTTGAVTLTGSNQIDGTATAANFNIGGSGIFFNGAIAGNLTYTTAGAATLSGGSDLAGSVNFSGWDGTLNLSNGSNVTGSIDTSGTRTGTLVFENSSSVNGDIGLTAAIKEIKANGTGTVVIGGVTNANTVNLNAAGIVAFTGGINTSLADGTLGNVNFNNYDGTVQIGAGGGLTGNVTTATNTNGTLTFVSGTQAMTGQIGGSAKEVKTLNIGGTGIGGGIDTNPLVASTTTITGNVFATSTVLNNNGLTTSSELKLASGSNLTGTSVTTTDANMGVLTLMGGTQTVTASVGAAGSSLNTVNSGANGATSNFGSDVFAVNVNNTGNGTSNFAANVTATNINVDSGISNFTNTVTATTARIGTGTGNFNTNGAGTTTVTDLNFTGAGTANLNNGLTFTNVNYAGNNATVNVSAGKNLTGTAITTTTAGTGYLNLLGGIQNVTASVGAAGLALNRVTVGADGATSNFTNGAAIYANTLDASGNGTVNLTGGLTGNLNYADAAAGQNGTVNFAAGTHLNGNVTTALNSTGILNLLGGTQNVTGAVGAAGAALNTVNAGAGGATSTFSSMVYANTLQFSGNGTVALNGTNGGGAVGGLVGVVDFGANGDTGTLQIDNGVNLTTGAGGINFRDANGATLTFLGNSTVTGEVGAPATVANTLASSTLKSIYAGAAGSTVTFSNDVHVSGNTFHVGAGTVNLVGDLYGPLLFDADGIVNVSSTKSIKNDPLDATVIGTVKTAANNTGTLNYLGSTTLSNDIGENAPILHLKAVNFHSDTTVAAVSQNIDKNIFATTTTIGNATTGTTANVTATGKFLGNSLTLAAANVALNTAGAVAPSAVSPVDFANTKNADGTLTNTATVTDSTTGTGVITTNGATMNFAMGTAAFVAGGANGVISAAGSSSIAGGAGSTLVMNGTEKINVSLLGSTRNAETYALIDVAAGAAGPQAATLADNSYVIDTTLSRSATGDLVLTTSRDVNTYVAKSGTSGHFSNAAATRLGALAASGTGYTSDMQTVLNKLDIDQWGYGNNQANLANQIKRLAPIANASGILTAFDATSNALYTLGEHLAVLRGDSAMAETDGAGYHFGAGKSAWVKLLGGAQSRNAIDNYDGFKTLMSGLVLGVDTKLGNGVIGLAGNVIHSTIDQQGFRDGDTGKMNTWGIGLYGTQQYGKVYVDGNLGYAQHSLDSNRTTALGRVAGASSDFKQISAKLAGGYRINLDDKGASVLTPMLSVEYGNLNQSAYTEAGAGALNLNVDSRTIDRTRGSLGLRYNTVLKGGTTSFYPEFMAAVNTQSMGNTDVAARYEGDTSGNTFTTPGVNVPNTSFTLGANLRVVPHKSIELQIGYRYEGGANLSSQMGEIRGIWAF